MSFVFGPIPAAAASLPTLVSIAVTPADDELDLHHTQQYTATGTYDDASVADITGSVTWSTGDSGIATITAAGLLTSEGRGTTTVIATLGAVSGSTEVIVPPPETDTGGWVWVAIIEGYPRLLCSHDATEALVAHTDFTEAIGECLVLDMVIQQELDIWDPFKGGGSCRLIVPPGFTQAGVATDQFGIDTHRSDGDETPLTATIDRDDAAIGGASTSNFAASGAVNIGIERIEYSAKAAQSFTVAADGRGTKVPYGRDNATRRFAHHHRGGDLNSDYQVPIETLITEQAKQWTGRRVGIFMHRRVDGVLETRAQVEAAGRHWGWRISGDIADDPATGATTIPLESEVDALGKTEMFRDQWRAKVAEGLYLFAGTVISIRDNNGATSEPGGSITVLPEGGTPVDESQIEADYYTAAELCSKFNARFQALKASSDLHGNYSWAVKNTADGPRVSCDWMIDGTQPNPVWWILDFTDVRLARFLGIESNGTAPGDGSWSMQVTGGADIDHDDDEAPAFSGGESPYRVILDRHRFGYLDITIGLAEEKGTLFDNRGDLPPLMSGWSVGGHPDWTNGAEPDEDDYEWGVFVVGGAFCCVAAYDGASDPKSLRYVINIGAPGFDDTGVSQIFDGGVGRREGESGDVEIRQIAIVAGKFWEVFARLFYSTGTAGYNHATYDTYGYGVGLGIPHEELGDDDDDSFIASLKALPGADLETMIVIDKPIQVAELLEADLIIRRGHLIWRNGHLEIARWALPTSEQSIHTFDEDNKAEQVGQRATLRSSPLITKKFAAARVTVRYNRSLRTGEYLSELPIIAPSLIDATDGKDDARELDCRNIYTDDVGVRALLADFIATHAYFAAPVRTMRRPIAPPLYHGVHPGEQALVDDDWARDPETGERGLADEPATIIRHMWSPPFVFAGSKQAQRGEVELAFVRNGRLAVYAPAAAFDGANYNAGTKTITCDDHVYSDDTDPVDAASYAANYEMRVTERDPDDPAAPITYLRGVVSVTGSAVVHDGAALGAGGSETAFDAAKDWIITFQAYASVGADQRSKAFSADNADAQIQDIAPPFLYGDPDATGEFGEDDHTVTHERYATIAVAEGSPRDTAYDRAHVRNVENLTDRKTAVQCPGIDLTETDPSGSVSGTDWIVTHQFEVFLGVQKLPSGIERYLYPSLWLRATTAGTKNARVSLCSRPLNGNTLVNAERQGLISEVIVTTSNTTGELPDRDPGTDAGLSLRIVDQDVGDWSGVAWIVVEVQDNLATRGVAHLTMGWREET